VHVADVAHLCERPGIEHSGDRLAHFEHDTPDVTGRFVTIVTPLVARAAGAGDGRQWTVKRTDDIADADVLRRASQAVAAPFALATRHKTGIAKFAEDGVKELFRDPVSGRNISDERQLSVWNPSEMNERLQTIFAFSG